MFWLLLFTPFLSKLKYLFCFCNKAKYFNKMASSWKRTEYQAKKKNLKKQGKKQNPLRTQFEVDMLWD